MPSMGVFYSRNLFSHNSGDYGCLRPRCQQGWLLLRPPFWACREMAVFSLCLHMVFLRRVSVPNLCFLQGHQPYWMRAHPSDLIITECPLQGLRLPIQSEVPGVRTVAYKFWGTLKGKFPMGQKPFRMLAIVELKMLNLRSNNLRNDSSKNCGTHPRECRPPSPEAWLSEVSVTHGQWWSRNIKWKFQK